MRKNGLSIIDDQMRPHAGRLGNEVRIQPPQAYSVATTIFDEIIASDTDLLEAIRNSSPLSVQRRLLFFEDYQTWDTVIRAATQCPSEHPLLPQIVQRSYIEMAVGHSPLLQFRFPRGRSLRSSQEESAGWILHQKVRTVRPWELCASLAQRCGTWKLANGNLGIYRLLGQ